LYELAGKLRTEVAKVDDVGLTFIVGGRPQEIRVEPDPARLAQHGVSLGGLMDAIRQANRAFPAGQVRNGGQAVEVTAGRPWSAQRDSA
jgi:multidrug efflux pump subunit AcrB